MDSGSVSFGNFTTKPLGHRPWKGGYPAHPFYIEEREKLLLFAESQGRRDHCESRLRGKLAQREESLNELRVAFHLKHRGFRIVEWEPAGEGRKKGEFSIARGEGGTIFVEVKSPGWEAELDLEQLRAGRKRKPKHMPEERRGGALGTWQHARACISRTYPKFARDSMNLLVIADDFFVPLDDRQMQIALYGPSEDPNYYGRGSFASTEFEILGGIARFKVELIHDFLSGRDHSLTYRFCLYPNPFALRRLPGSFGTSAGVSS